MARRSGIKLVLKSRKICVIALYNYGVTLISWDYERGFLPVDRMHPARAARILFCNVGTVFDEKVFLR